MDAGPRRHHPLALSLSLPLSRCLSFFYSFYVCQVAACFTWIAWKKNEYFTEHNCHLCRRLWHANEQDGCVFRQDKWGVADSTLYWWADTPWFSLWFITYPPIGNQVPHVLCAYIQDALWFNCVLLSMTWRKTIYIQYIYIHCDRII